MNNSTTTFRELTSDLYDEEPSREASWTNNVSIVLSCLIIVVNIPVFLIVPKITSLQNNTGSCMISLAVSDTALGFLLLVQGIVRTRYFIDSSSVICLVSAFGTLTSVGTSMFILCLMNVDKYLTIAFPFRYINVLTRTRFRFVIAALWVFEIIIVGIAYLYKPVEHGRTSAFCLPDMQNNAIFRLGVLFCGIILPTLGISISFVGIYRIAKSQKQKISDQSNAEAQAIKTDREILKILFVMTAGFYITVIPNFLFQIIWEGVSSSPKNESVIFVGGFLMCSNSCMNPLLYIPTVKPYRLRLISLLHLERLFRSGARQVEDEQHTTSTAYNTNTTNF